MNIDPRLTEFATVRQLEFIEAIERHGSLRQAAKALGTHNTVLSRSMIMLRKKAALAGYAPDHGLTHPVAPGQRLRGASQLYRRGESEPLMTWVKSTADHDAREQILRELAEALSKDVKPLAPTKPPAAHADADLLAVIPMGDPHIGMYAWSKETGNDWDLGIAERLTRGAIDRLIASSPDAGTGLMLCLGDLFHADNQSNESQSGHQLDVDGRWAKVLQVGLDTMLYCARRMLEKYPRVILRFNKGNHDGHSAYALALMVSCWFKDEPRMTVDLSPAPTWYHQHGKVLIGSNHGDKIKAPAMVPLMAAEQAVAWGQTTHRYVYVGHVHHSSVQEFIGGTVEYFRTIAARDAWHTGMGYRAGRDMCLIVHHREVGEVERHRCDVASIG